jgi:hypothetical protein
MISLQQLGAHQLTEEGFWGEWSDMVAEGALRADNTSTGEYLEPAHINSDDYPDRSGPGPSAIIVPIEPISAGVPTTYFNPHHVVAIGFGIAFAAVATRFLPEHTRSLRSETLHSMRPMPSGSIAKQATGA